MKGRRVGSALVQEMKNEASMEEEQDRLHAQLSSPSYYFGFGVSRSPGYIGFGV